MHLNVRSGKKLTCILKILVRPLNSYANVLAIKVIGINTWFIFLELAVEAKILITETDFGSLVYLLNLFLGNCGAGENTSCMQISWLCSVTHHPGAVTSAEGAISKLRPVSKAEHPAKNTLAS